MMTVHKAKGLEFPVVILADIDAPSRFRTATSYVEPDRGLAAIEVIDCMPWELHENQELEGAREEAEAVRRALSR